jgi:hypothetical protein
MKNGKFGLKFSRPGYKNKAADKYIIDEAINNCSISTQ